MAILEPGKQQWVRRHLLLMGNTKTGKTRYVVEAIRDGYECIYVDNDNGLTTIQDSLSSTPDAFKRLHYFNPGDMEAFVAEFLTAGVFRYNESRRNVYDPTNAAPGDKLCEIYPGRIPQRVIFALDSWTSLSYKSLRNQAVRKSIDLADIDKFSREIYGGSGFQITRIAQLLQTVPFGVIALAHGANYERKKKPVGVRASEVKEADMVIVETMMVPISTSLPHGYTIGKHFDEIGNLSVKPVSNAREISFMISADQISGGTPNSKGDPLTTHRFSTLFGKSPTPIENEPPFIKYTTVAELRAATQAAKAAAAPPPKPTAPAAAPLVTPAPSKIPQPVVKSGSIVSGTPKLTVG